MGCAEGRSPFAGCLRVSLSYRFPPPPLPGQEEGARSGECFPTCRGSRSIGTLIETPIGAAVSEGMVEAVLVGRKHLPLERSTVRMASNRLLLRENYDVN